VGIACRWFAFEVLEHLAGRDACVGHHLQRIVDFSLNDICPKFAGARGYSEPKAALKNNLPKLILTVGWSLLHSWHYAGCECG
jgi:hypothetical protein